MGARDNYRYIIDCLLNVPLLYWASETTGDAHYADLAHKHVTTCLGNSIRADGSTYHTFFMDPETGAPVRGATCQGYKDDSCWARGQAGVSTAQPSATATPSGRNIWMRSARCWPTTSIACLTIWFPTGI